MRPRPTSSPKFAKAPAVAAKCNCSGQNREITTWRQDDPSCDFAGLVEAVHEIDGVERIQFASPHPRHVTPQFLDAMERMPKICRHLHLPVQSGSTRILRAMRRRYSREKLPRTRRTHSHPTAERRPFDRHDRCPGESEADEDTLT